MFPLLALALSFTLLSSSTSLAQLEDSGNFTMGDEGEAPNWDSEAVPGLSMQQPTYGGNGCPQGTANAILSGDGRSLSVLFDAYSIEVGNHVGMLRDAKSCQINIPFTVPAGYAVQVVKMNYRGFTALPAGTRSTFGAGYRFLEINGRETNAPRVLRANVMLGPKQENFMLTSVIRGPSTSPCGQNFVLAAESLLNVASNRQGEQAMSTIDSLDAVQTPVVYSLRWVRCAGGSPGGGGFERPDRPRPPRTGIPTPPGPRPPRFR